MRGEVLLLKATNKVFQFLTHIGRYWGLYSLLMLATMLQVLFAYAYASHTTDQSVSVRTAAVNGVTTEKSVLPTTTTSTAGSASAAPVSPDTPELSTAPVAPQCYKTTNPMPSALTLSLNRPGLSQSIASPQLYPVYGFTSQEVQRQINSCSPVVYGAQSYAASTNYVINWQFNYTMSNGICTIKDVAVGVNITQVYPQWQPSPYATRGYGDRWNAFIGNLTAHENVHRDLDLQYAGRILSDIQSIPPTDCSVIAQTGHNLAHAQLAALKVANESFDAATNHGATQGAIIP